MGSNETGLKNRIGSDFLIGCYGINEKGTGVFTDIRGEEGDLVENPVDDSLELSIAYNKETLETGVFYSFRWHLENDDMSNIIVDGIPEKVDNVQFLTKLFDARCRLHGSNLRSFIDFQNTIFNEVTGALHTYIYELLQNANDYPHNKEHVSVKFILTKHYLFFMHSGEYFNLRNIVGISNINQGEKRKNTETIGYKGIGFKTVFVNNDYVYLKSGDWSLRFDKAYSESKMFGKCPWALMPIPTSKDELDQEVCTTLDANKLRVQFALRHKRDARENIAQLNKVFSDNQILLFIPNVYKVDVIINGETVHEVIKDDSKWTVSDFHYDIPKDLKEWVEKNINSGDKIPEKFKEIDKARISFAVAREGNTLIPVANARVYNYLPTELYLGFPFLLNADFVPNGSRSGLHDVNWNDRIMEQCGVRFADWWTSFLTNEGEYDIESVFGILPDFNSKDKYARLFIAGFSKRIQEIPCIPTDKDGKYQLVKLEDVVWDKIEFVACENAILTDDEFYEFTDTTGFLPHPDIRCNEHLIRLLRHFDCSLKFGDSELLQLCLESDFAEWLRQGDNDQCFIGYLLKSGYLQNCWNYKIFLTEDDKIDKAEHLYYDIDAYINDIAFLAPEMPRLNVQLRDYLSTNYDNWDSNKNRFMKFQDVVFVKKIFNNFHKYEPLLKLKENNVHFVHFLAVVGNTMPTPANFPYFTEDGICMSHNHTLYQKNAIGTALKEHAWINKEWINFIHEDYFKEDSDKVAVYLNTQCGIHGITTKECYTKIIANESNIPTIAEEIKSIENNIDFYRYMATIQDEFVKLSETMRNQFVVYVTDGKNTWNVLIRQTIFKKDSDWEEMAKVSWMPEKCCLAISDTYFDNLSTEEAAKLESLFSGKQIVQKFSIAGFCTPLRMQLSEVMETLKTKEISKEFLNFLFLNHIQINKSGIKEEQLRAIPILRKDTETLIPLNQLKGNVYIPSKEALELYNMPWMNRDYLALCDDYYTDLFDGTERREFFNSIGIKTFNKLHYLRAHLLNKLDRVKAQLKERENNISFHHYLAEVHEDLSDKDLEPVKEMPVYLSSPTEEKGDLCDSSTNHYLPSSMITDIISKDLVPVSIMDSIHPDYFKTINKDYFEKKLGNVEFDEDSFYGYLTGDGIIADVRAYLHDQERNIRFWRWVADSKAKKEQKAKLSVLPMLGRECGDEQDSIVADPSCLYVSSLYLGVNDFEAFINEYVSRPKFVSPSYFEEGIDRDWLSLFKAVKITVDYKEIVFNHILPHLDRYKNTGIISILAKYRESIVAKLNDDDKTIRGYLNNLYLQCKDGSFRTPKDVRIAGKYFDIDIDPFKDVVISNLVSEVYIDNCGNDYDLRRHVIKLITAIAGHYKVGLENLTQLRNAKLRYFAKHQSEFYQTEAHYNIIGEFADDFERDDEGIKQLQSETDAIKLCTTDGKIANSDTLYLSTVYNPDCQFMANGITGLPFVSEEYVKYGEHNVGKLFTRLLGVKYDFTRECFPLLKNEEFAIYFWTNYAPRKQCELQGFLTDEYLKSIPCIPTTHGVKKPMELYDYRNQQLQKIVLRLTDGQSKLPSVELPKWIDRIGLRNRLYLLDCLEYLQLDTHDFRRDVIKWIVETPGETIERNQTSIKEYTKTAHWFSGDKEWRDLSSLVALEWGNNTLKGNFSGNAHVCNPSYMPESQTDFNRLCEILGIKILTNKDFTKRKVGACKSDDEAIHEIDNRLLYLAYKSQKEDWKTLYDEYKQKLHNADISLCEQIVYSYNEDISTDLMIYAEDAHALWYTESWRGPMFLEVLDWIINKLKVKGDFDVNFLRKLFLGNFRDFIQKEEGGSLPQELLDCLEESYREGIKEDTNANAEQFNEGINPDHKLSEDLRESARTDKEYSSSSSESGSPVNMQSPQESEDQDPTSENGGIESSTDSRSNTEYTERKRRSDYGGTHNRTASSRENAGDRPYYDSSEDNDSEPQEEKSIAERMKEKWENKAQRQVGRPHSSSSPYSLVNPASGMEGKIDNKPTDEPFFAPSNDYNYSDQKSYGDYSRTSQNMKRRKTEAQNSAQSASDQMDVFELWQQTPKYTFLWFKYLMELQFDDDGKTHRRQAQIDFRDYEVRTNKIVRLQNPSVAVPLWLENAGTIDILLIGKTQHKVQGTIVKISEEGVDLQLCNDDQDKFADLYKVRVNAESSTNIVDSLTTRFLQLDYEDDYNLNDNLPKDIKFIYGPPGTGKTTRLVQILHDIVTTNDDVKKILVLTPTNKAADVIATKLVDDADCYKYLTRFGSTESQYLIEDAAILCTRDNMNLDVLDRNIVVTTMARYSYDCMQPDDIAICDVDWDYIIIDEASMIELVSITYVLHKAEGSKFIIAGDPKQIQPIRQKDIDVQNIYQMVGLDGFRDAINNYKRYPVEALMVQHRSIPTIGNLVSKFAYNGLVQNDADRAPQKALEIDGIPTKNVNFIGFNIEEFDNLYGLTSIDNSALHLYSAIFTYNMVDYIVKQITSKYPNMAYSIGIVCPYKAEAEAIKQLTENRSLDTANCKVTSGTVHKFQGDECDIMFIVLNPPANVSSHSHINTENIINVAMSRARDYIFFILPSGQIDGFNVKNRLGNIIDQKDRTLQYCSDIETVMFGNRNYIYENTNVSCHLPVNVFYDCHAKYEVRIDDTALDIEINEDD